MIFSILFNSLLHETRKRRKNVDGGIDLLIVELSINEDLTFSNITGQIGNRMGDVVVLNKAIITGIDKMGI